MSFIWFILFIVFLILWRSAASDLKSSKNREYQKGVYDGYEMAKNQTRAVRHSNQNDTDTLDQFLGLNQPRQDADVQLDQAPIDNDEFDQDSVATDGNSQLRVPVESIYPSANTTDEEKFVPDPKEVERAKTLQTLKNLNIILYVASFLIVAATAIFITLTMPAGVKLACLVAVTAAFYGVGLFMHSKSTNLKPAAVAFVGTGLAIIPFIGFALTSLGDFTNEAAWLLTSLVGLVAYAVAAVRLQSQLVSYITMAFVLSTALSAVSILSLGVMWYFVVVIGVSLMINCVYILAPNLLSKLFTKPLRDTGLAVTPVALVASLFTIQSMELWMYAVLFAVATAHYMAVWLIQKTRTYELAVRVLVHMTAIIFTIDAVGKVNRYTIVTIGCVWLGLAVLQVVYSLWRAYRDKSAAETESAYVGVAVGLMVVFMPLWQMTSIPYHWTAISLSVIGLVCIVSAYLLKQVGWLYGALVVSVSLPFIVGREVVSPALPFGVIAGMFVLAGAAALFYLDRLVSSQRLGRLYSLLNISVWTYAVVVGACGLLANEVLTLGWTTALAATMLVTLSYLTRSVIAEVVGAVLGVVSIGAWADKLLINNEWQLVVTIVLSVATLAIGAAIHQYFGQTDRRDSLITIGMIVFGGLIVATVNADVTVIRTATLLLLLAGVGGIIARGLLGNRDQKLSMFSLSAYVVYPFLALATGLWLGGGWLVLVLLAVTGISWASSYMEKQPGLILLGNIAFALSLVVLWLWLEFNEQWAIYGVVWISAGVYYLIHWYSYSRQDESRMTLALGSVLAMLAIATIYGVSDLGTQYSLSSAGSMLMIAGVLAIHGYLIKHKNYMEGALYVATAGAQWMVSLLVPEIGAIVYAHWWAVMIFLAAVWRGSYKERLIVALSFVTLSTGFYALVNQGGYSLFFLAEHLIVAIAGAMLRKQWAMWWGIVAVVVAVLYFLKDYTFLALLFIGLILILFVVWRLTKIGNKNNE